jgi:hypothetical protein
MSEREDASPATESSTETDGGDGTAGGEREGLDTQDLYNGPDGYAEESAKSER